MNLLNFNGIDWNLKYTISARNGGQIYISGGETAQNRQRLQQMRNKKLKLEMVNNDK